MNQVNLHTKSGADQGSAFHGSYRTRTAKLCSRICPRGEFCMRSFWHSYVFMKYVLPTLFGGRRKIRSTVRLSPRSFTIGVCTKECIVERSAPGGRISSLREIPPWKFWILHGFAKSFYVIFQRDRIFLKNRFRQKTYTAYQTIYLLRLPQ